MKFGDMQKGELNVYYRFVRNDSPEAMIAEPGEKHPAYTLGRYVIVKKGDVFVTVARLSPKGRPYGATVFRRMSGDWAPFYSTVADAKAALVNGLSTQVKDTEKKLATLTAELNEALLYEI